MKSVLIIGLGRFGRHMARRLSEQGDEVLGIDNSEERINAALPYLAEAQIGEATNGKFLESLGLDNFDLCVVAIGDHFETSLVVTNLLKEKGARLVLSRAYSDTHAKFLLRNGADEVAYPERETARRVAVKYGSDRVFDYVEMSPDYAVYEIATPTAWIGRSIAQMDVRNTHNVIIIGTKYRGELQIPQSDYIFNREDTLILIGHNDDIRILLKK